MIHSNSTNKKSVIRSYGSSNYHIYGYCDYKIFPSTFNPRLKNHKTENEIPFFF